MSSRRSRRAASEEVDTAAAKGQKCPKALTRFADSDGAGRPCEMRNRSMANRQIFNCLDETMASW
jgi:hypothetical protein